jgi:hypothetical protein
VGAFIISKLLPQPSSFRLSSTVFDFSLFIDIFVLQFFCAGTSFRVNPFKISFLKRDASRRKTCFPLTPKAISFSEAFERLNAEKSCECSIEANPNEPGT